MKITFLVGPPRCGSLALKNILQNHILNTTHEGNDWRVLFDKDMPFKDTYCFKKIMEAYYDGCHFMSCDVSSNPALFNRFCQDVDLIRGFIGGGATVQIIRMKRDVLDCAESLFNKYSESNASTKDMSILDIAGKIAATEQNMDRYLDDRKESMARVGIKVYEYDYGASLTNNGFFSNKFLFDIAEKVGCFPGEWLKFTKSERETILSSAKHDIMLKSLQKYSLTGDELAISKKAVEDSHKKYCECGGKKGHNARDNQVSQLLKEIVESLLGEGSVTGVKKVTPEEMDELMSGGKEFDDIKGGADDASISEKKEKKENLPYKSRQNKPGSGGAN